LDIPRVFDLPVRAHRIEDPFTPETLATLGAALRLEPVTRRQALDAGRCP